MHPNFDRQIANIQQIYGIPSKRNKKLDRLSPPKSSKKSVLALDIEGESKPILNKYKKNANIFQAQEELLSELGLSLFYFIFNDEFVFKIFFKRDKKGNGLKLPDLTNNKVRGMKLLNMELNVKKKSENNLDNLNSNKMKEINKIYKSNIATLEEMKEKYKNPYKSPLRIEKTKINKNINIPMIN